MTQDQYKYIRKVYRSQAWKRARAQCLRRDGRRCTECGRVGRLEVHHRKPMVQGGHPFKLSNLRTLCRDCHFAADAAARARAAAAADPVEAERQAWAIALDGPAPGAAGADEPAPLGTHELMRQMGDRKRQARRARREARAPEAPAPAPAPESTGGGWGSGIV